MKDWDCYLTLAFIIAMLFLIQFFYGFIVSKQHEGIGKSSNYWHYWSGFSNNY